MIPYGIIFILSVVDIYKDLGNDVLFDKVNNNNTTRYNNYYRNYNNNYKTNSTAYHSVNISKVDTSKVRNMLKKSKAIKVLKEKK